MKTNVEKFKKRRQERATELTRRKADLEALRDQRQRMEDAINAAIDAENTDQAERLVVQENALETKIEVLERTISRKSQPAVDRAEIVEAANQEAADYQNRIDQLQDAVIKAKKAYLAKLIELGSLINEAWDTRTEYCSLIEDIEDPTTANVQTRDFIGVSSQIGILWNPKDADLASEVNPDAPEIMAKATMARLNLWAGRDNRPPDPGVTVSK